jgi:hypothetical protein
MPHPEQVKLDAIYRRWRIQHESELDQIEDPLDALLAHTLRASIARRLAAFNAARAARGRIAVAKGRATRNALMKARTVQALQLRAEGYGAPAIAAIQKVTTRSVRRFTNTYPKPENWTCPLCQAAHDGPSDA